jgi:hypothetical protein
VPGKVDGAAVVGQELGLGSPWGLRAEAQLSLQQHALTGLQASQPHGHRLVRQSFRRHDFDHRGAA